jgi:hypothetical protein
MSWNFVLREGISAMAVVFGRQIYLLSTCSAHSAGPSARAIVSSANSIFGKNFISRQRALKIDGLNQSGRLFLTSANVMNFGTDAAPEHAAPVVPSFMQNASDDTAKTYNPPEIDNVSGEFFNCNSYAFH